MFHRKVPDVLPPGNVLVIEPESSGSLWQLGEAIHNPIVARQDKDSPLMLHIRLDNVVMPEARKLALKVPARVLAESAGGDPIYAVLDRADGGTGKVVLLTVDLDKSDLPLQTAFPIMMSNLLNWFGGTKGELREAIAAGGVAEVELPAPRQRRRRACIDGSRRPPNSSIDCASRCDQGHRRPARPHRRLDRGPRLRAGDRRRRSRDGAGLQPGRSPRERPPTRSRSPRPPARVGRGVGGPADLVLFAGLGPHAHLLGVVPLSAKMDRLREQVASGEWRVASGEWRAASGEWRAASGKRQAASGKRQAASGKWQVTSGKWQAAGGK